MHRNKAKGGDGLGESWCKQAKYTEKIAFFRSLKILARGLL
jgi:hypothetical protein